jgi:protoporphyrinogen oxidase
MGKTTKMKEILIVGAGVTGMTIGSILAGKGHKVVILEKESAIGGLARSFRYDGFTFDAGPHRVFTSVAGIYEFIRNALGGECRSFRRCSEVHMFNRYYPWPLSPSSLFKYPFKIMVGTVADLVLKRMGKYFDDDIFADYICSRYGRTIYKAFFLGIH